MLDVIKFLGAGGMLGAVIGIALVMWVEPTTGAGVAFIIVFSTVIFALLLQAVRAMVYRGTSTAANGLRGEGLRESHVTHRSAKRSSAHERERRAKARGQRHPGSG
jgi:hypothetical protein